MGSWISVIPNTAFLFRDTSHFIHFPSSKLIWALMVSITRKKKHLHQITKKNNLPRKQKERISVPCSKSPTCCLRESSPRETGRLGGVRGPGQDWGGGWTMTAWLLALSSTADLTWLTIDTMWRYCPNDLTARAYKKAIWPNPANVHSDRIISHDTNSPVSLWFIFLIFNSLTLTSYSRINDGCTNFD